MTDREGRPYRPTKADLAEASNKVLDDIIAEDLDVLFVGINPGLYSAAIGHHFGRPGNRFWPSLYGGGFTPTLYSPAEELRLLEHRLGITNFVPRASARADELTTEELTTGAATLTDKVARYKPFVVAPLGVTAYRTAFRQPAAQIGLQPEKLADAFLWVLPNPSGLNAHYTLADLARLFGELREWTRRHQEKVPGTVV